MVRSRARWFFVVEIRFLPAPSFLAIRPPLRVFAEFETRPGEMMSSSSSSVHHEWLTSLSPLYSPLFREVAGSAVHLRPTNFALSPVLSLIADHSVYRVLRFLRFPTDYSKRRKSCDIFMPVNYARMSVWTVTLFIRFLLKLFLKCTNYSHSCSTSSRI